MAMAFFIFNLFSIALSIVVSCANADTSFDTNYKPQWGFNHITNNQEREVQLLLDQSSGAGFQSKSSFCYGSFRMRMKISNQSSGGVVSSFYLIGPPTNNPPRDSRGNHDEFDFEFLGTGNAASLQTNVFANDDGQREQKIRLWFDPSQAFHTYELVWNPNQVVLNVDGSPVRVFKKGPGVNFALKAMHVEASIWNVSWAGVVDWSKGPFTAHYQGFDIVATQTSSDSFCEASLSDGTVEKKWELSPKQQRQYEEIRKKYLIWDYCSDKSRYHPECEK